MSRQARWLSADDATIESALRDGSQQFCYMGMGKGLSYSLYINSNLGGIHNWWYKKWQQSHEMSDINHSISCNNVTVKCAMAVYCLSVGRLKYDRQRKISWWWNHVKEYWLGLCLAGQVNVKSGISDWNVPTDADAIAAATVQTSAVIVYTLYDCSWSQDV